MAFLAGLHVQEFTQSSAVVTVTYRYLTKNPFRSIYFAVLSMAAELSTGVLAFAYVYQQPVKVSMLVVNMQAQFYKKATGTIQFICNDGAAIQLAITNAIQTGESVIVICRSSGVNRQGELVANFEFTWSFKRK